MTFLTIRRILFAMISNVSQQHIYVFATKFPIGVTSYYLPIARREEIDACPDEKVRNQKYFAFKLLELAISAVYGKRMRDCNFVKDDFGKWTCDLCEFSIAHSNDIVIVALSDMPVGVDFESIDLNKFDARLQQRVFSKKEQAAAWGMTAEQRAEYANRLWTVKQAIFKRQGGKNFVAEQVETDCEKYKTAILNDGDKHFYVSVATTLDATVDFHSQRLTITKIQP